MTRNIPLPYISEEQIESAFGPVVASFGSNQVPTHIINALFPHDKSIPSARWSFLNRLIMLSFGTTDARTYSQWERARRTVNPGSQPTYILSPAHKYFNSSLTRKNSVWESYAEGYTATTIYKQQDTSGDSELLRADTEIIFQLLLKTRAIDWGITTNSFIPSNRLGFTCYSTRSRCLRFGSRQELEFLQNLVSAVYSRSKIPPISYLLSTKRDVVPDLCVQVLGQMMRKKFVGSAGDSYRYVKKHAADVGSSPENFCSVVLKEVERTIRLILSKK